MPIDRQIIPTPIKIAQFIKNSCGKTVIISSKRGSKVQLSLPAKKILWKIINAFSKFIETTPNKITIIASTEIAETNATEYPNGRASEIILRLFKIKSVIIIAEDKSSAIKLILNKTLQSAKCAAPSSENLNTPAPNLSPGKVR